MAVVGKKTSRVFKTALFSKRAKKARIQDDELCTAIAEIMRGQAVDLGGGVFKKRLNENMHRSIILAKGGKVWVFEYLFAKNDRDNIGNDELEQFRKLAKAYEALTVNQIAQLVNSGNFMEICHGDDEKNKI